MLSPASEGAALQAVAGGVPSLRGLAGMPWWVRFLRDPIGCLVALRARHGDLVALRRPFAGPGRGRFVFALGPEYNRSVLTDTARFHATGQTLPGPRGSAQRRVRYGLTRTRGERHAEQRALLLPLFQRPAIREQADAMSAAIESQLCKWAVGETRDLKLEMRLLMLHLSSEVLFGREDPERSWRLGEAIGDWLSRNFQGRVWLGLVDLPGTPYRDLLKRAVRIEREIEAMVAAKRAAGTQGDDVVSTLIRARSTGSEWMSYRDLVGQATMLFAASYETTANAMIWTLLLLAQHPEVTHALAQELAGSGPGLDALERLPLLDAVLRESMRLFPPVPYAIRLAAGGGKLGELELEPRDRVVVSHYVTHRLPELYADPDRFDPSRWSGARKSPYEFLPFSAGPRTCIGINFANAAMKLSLAAILARFRPALLPGTRIDRSVAVTLSPRGAVPMKLCAPGDTPAPVELQGDVREMLSWPSR